MILLKIGLTIFIFKEKGTELLTRKVIRIRVYPTSLQVNLWNALRGFQKVLITFLLGESMKFKGGTLYTHLETHFSMSIEELIEIIKIEIPDVIDEFSIEKKNSEKRIVYSVKKISILWSTQKLLNKVFFSELKFPDYVFGFQKNKSYFGFLLHHINQRGNKSFLKLDIKDFFDSIDGKELISNLVDDFEDETERKEELLDLFTLVLTYNNKLPQGYQTSPILSNFFFLRADLRIKKYCDKLNFRYSRYADDILLSSIANNEKLFSKRVITMIDSIINDFGLHLNRKKTKSAEKELNLNGFVISKDVRLSQKKLKELRRILFIIEHSSNEKDSNEVIKKINLDPNCNKENKKRSFSLEYLLKYLSGNRSFLIDSIKGSSPSSNWYEQASSLISRIESATLRMFL